MAYLWVVLPSYLPLLSRLASLGFQDTRGSLASLGFPPGTDTLWLIYGWFYLPISPYSYPRFARVTVARYSQPANPARSQGTVSYAWVGVLCLGVNFATICIDGPYKSWRSLIFLSTSPRFVSMALTSHGEVAFSPWDFQLRHDLYRESYPLQVMAKLTFSNFATICIERFLPYKSWRSCILASHFVQLRHDL